MPKALLIVWKALLIVVVLLPMLLGFAAAIVLIFQPSAVDVRQKDLWGAVLFGLVPPLLYFASELLGWLNRKVTGEH